MNEDSRRGENLSKFPKYGWKVSLDHKFPEKRDQNIKPKISQLPQLLPLFVRYLLWYITIRSRKRKPFIDCVTMLNGKQIYGVPLGGIGSGTIGRGFKGEFCRYNMIPGIYEYNTVMANQFIVTIRDSKGNTLYQKVLSPYSKYKKGLKSWEWGFSGADGLYCGLYPRSWTVYNIKEQCIRLICRQVSPVLPHNYKDSCLPTGVFIWTVQNNNSEPRDVSITLSFKNGTGDAEDKLGESWTESHHEEAENSSATCVVLHQIIKGMNLRYCIGVKTDENTLGSYCLGFDPLGSGEVVWNSLKKSGHLRSEGKTLPKTSRGEERAIAICGQKSIMPNSSETIEIALSWDMPEIVFRSRGKSYSRRYTRWFSNPDTASKDIVSYALSNYKVWEKEIEKWQDPILKDPDLPDWFKSALFNELYFISDGGSLWLEMPEADQLPSQDPRIEYGRFAYLESHEYRMYNTYDVHFYASWALILLWPNLQKSIQYDMADFTASADLSNRTYLYSGDKGAVKLPNAVPHDVGDPEDEPFKNLNAYIIHNCNSWKDLNLKFVLQVYRDYAYLKDDAYLQRMWPICRAVMDRAFSYDQDSDGLIENNGDADQTYDSWVMHGPSAYCSSLWVASLACMVEMALTLRDKSEELKFEEALNKAKKALYEKLYNGEYFNFDSCNGSHSQSIMSDQLVGHWYLALSGLKAEVFRRDSVKSALKLLFEKNVKCFKNGEMGAVNGMLPDGTIDCYTMQSEEMWVGVTYGLAATMIFEGMLEEGFATAEGVYRTVYEKIGQGFETPEALYADSKYRAIGYMRPLSIWSMYRAYQMNKELRDSM
ncbi:Non-lysosomal glucosylceramidase [Armadillidium nasatum]|uniref:Non-lysosomal glucosylceramidase n=1 Tax=Armadillidium nasatum TaxID=96803 RepID=A0A5N5T0V1_9CRUS|nr:Non-lysosomal glucosylceramidase [Armadillidium nasatum]